MLRLLMKLGLRHPFPDRVSPDDTSAAADAAEETLKRAMEALKKSEEILAARRRLNAIDEARPGS